MFPNIKITGWDRLVVTVLLLAVSAGVSAKTLNRELYILVEFEAVQNWVGEESGEPGQHSKATSHQRYELRTSLNSTLPPQSRNILHADLTTRLAAKTLYLASKAQQRLAERGDAVSIPKTTEQANALVQRMQVDQANCKDEECRNDIALDYAAIFAVMQQPELLKGDAGPRRFRYFDSYKGCPGYTHVAMQVAIKGVHYNETYNKLVPFTETRKADVENTKDESPLCEHYLAVIDQKDAEKPLYLENYYLPSAVGTTSYAEGGDPTPRTERQPMPSAVLKWVSETLKHAPASGSTQGVVNLTLPLNGISTTKGTYTGTATVDLTWHFTESGAK